MEVINTISDFLACYGGAPQYVMLGSLAFAILAALFPGRILPPYLRERWSWRAFYASLLGCLGVCVGLTAWLLVYFLGVGPWTAFLPAIPLGAVLLLLLMLGGE